MNENKCPYCHQYKDDGYLYEDDISAITKNLYGKAQQVKWTGKNLNNYEADYDDGSVYKADCYQDCKIVCTNKGKYFLAVDGEWTTYFPINCCPICRRDFNEGKIMSSFYITCVDGTPILNIVETNAGFFELWWKDSYQCNLGTFKTYEAAVDAIYKHYGRGRVIKC